MDLSRNGHILVKSLHSKFAFEDSVQFLQLKALAFRRCGVAGSLDQPGSSIPTMRKSRVASRAFSVAQSFYRLENPFWRRIWGGARSGSGGWSRDCRALAVPSGSVVFCGA